ncbi:crosslink repair DNA glycosylase YcaQ family protein [Kiritimatiellaeota bacterium B1221]|nr:crosslink repair DNA glycosylase YcaQ family protein [Kiritimatiellaeota bacterium B1221]
MTESLSIQQARKLALLSQRLPASKSSGKAEDATLSAVEHLGYIQIDTLSVVQRAHHHTLWNRNPRYQAGQLDQLIAEKKVFEYWSHAASYLPFGDYRYSLPRKQALKDGTQRHWFSPDAQMLRYVLDRIRSEGPLMAKDFEQSRKPAGDWGVKPAKQALELLFMQGDLMVSERVNFHKVYDLTERVLPATIDATVPTAEEQARHLIVRYLRANGIGTLSEFTYLRKGVKTNVSATLSEMLAGGEVMRVLVGSAAYYALPASMALLKKPLARSKLKILSPFDNLVIQRKRIQALFGFDYLIECYLPAAKRKYGYFCLPICWDGKLVARMDCKADRKASALHIYHLALEPGVLKVDEFILALQKELKAFLKFNDCTELEIHKVTPPNLKSAFSR